MYLFSETNDIGNWREFFDEGIKIAYAQNALIKDLEKKNEEKKSLIEELRENNKRSVDRNYKLINECADLKEKNKKLSEELAKKNKENKEIEEWRHLIDVLQKNLELKDKDIQALMDQIEQLKNVIFNLNLKIYGKKDDNCCEK